MNDPDEEVRQSRLSRRNRRLFMQSVGALGLGLTAGASIATAHENGDEEHDDTGEVESDTDETDDGDMTEIEPEAFKLLAADGEARDRFGYSVSVDDDTALVGAFREGGKYYNVGAAYVFTRSGDTWSQQAKLLADDREVGDFFGRSVSVDGDTALVGANGDDEQGTRAGAAYVFTRSGDTWSQQAKLLAADGEARDYFGVSVSIDGDTALVGANGEDDPGSVTGAAYVFTRSGDTWSQQAKLLADDREVGDFFGRSVSIDGDTALVGALRDNETATSAGAAYVFTCSGSTWSQQAKLLAEDGEARDWFGRSVSVDDDTALVGAVGDNEQGNCAGSTYVFTRSGSAWSQQAKLLAADGEANDGFGTSVSVDGASALVGALFEDEQGNNAGAAYVFTRSGSAWPQQAKLLAADGEARDWFGSSISVDDDTALVGAPNEDEKGEQAGAAYAFDVSSVLDAGKPDDNVGSDR